MSLHTSFWHFRCSADLQPPGLMIINVTVQTVPSVTHTHEHTLNTICSIRTPLVGKHTIKVRVTIVYYVECTVSSRKLSRLARSTLSSNCICSACMCEHTLMSHTILHWYAPRLCMYLVASFPGSPSIRRGRHFTIRYL